MKFPHDGFGDFLTLVQVVIRLFLFYTEAQFKCSIVKKKLGPFVLRSHLHQREKKLFDIRKAKVAKILK